MAKPIVIGLSATPIRLKKTEGIGDKFTHMVKAPPVHELMDRGRLCRLKYYGFNVGAIDTTGVHTVAGDYKLDELELAADKPEVLEHAVKQWRRLADGRRTLAFCVSVRHAEDLARTFNEAGIPAATVTGETPREERQEIYRRLEAKELQLISSVNVLSIGFDSPIGGECLLLCRPTKSLAVHLQQLGRGARVHPDKDGCLVLDQSGNCLKHGPLEADHAWRLNKGDEPGPGGGEGFPMKACVECGHLMLPQVHICPECGAEQPVKEKAIRTDNLVELVFNKAERRQREQLHRWIQKAYKQGYLHGWVAKQYEQKYGQMPQADQWLGAIYGTDPHPDHAGLLASHWGRVCRKKNRTWSVALTALTREFGTDFLEAQDLGALRAIWQNAYSTTIAI
jgi:superfamily II DNA or RNA helicase